MTKEIYNKPTTAILIFSRSTDLESKVKQLGTNQKANHAFWEACRNNVFDQAKQSNLPYFVFDENNQVGNGFGEKIANAFKTVFDLGYEKVIAIGNDCLSLNANKLLKANALFQKFDFVAGPDTRGGTYLLGIQVKDFDKTAFSNFNWNSARLLFDILQFYKEKSIFLFQKQVDVNLRSDLFVVLKLQKINSIFKKLIQDLYTAIHVFAINTIQLAYVFIGNTFNKGSPQF